MVCKVKYLPQKSRIHHSSDVNLPFVKLIIGVSNSGKCFAYIISVNTSSKLMIYKVSVTFLRLNKRGRDKLNKLPKTTLPVKKQTEYSISALPIVHIQGSATSSLKY